MARFKQKGVVHCGFNIIDIVVILKILTGHYITNILICY